MYVRLHEGKTVVTRSDWSFLLCIEDLQMVKKLFLQKQGQQVTRFKNECPEKTINHSKSVVSIMFC